MICLSLSPLLLQRASTPLVRGTEPAKHRRILRILRFVRLCKVKQSKAYYKPLTPQEVLGTPWGLINQPGPPTPPGYPTCDIPRGRQSGPRARGRGRRAAAARGGARRAVSWASCRKGLDKFKPPGSPSLGRGERRSRAGRGRRRAPRTATSHLYLAYVVLLGETHLALCPPFQLALWHSLLQ